METNEPFKPLFEVVPNEFGRLFGAERLTRYGNELYRRLLDGEDMPEFAAFLEAKSRFDKFCYFTALPKDERQRYGY